MGSSIAGELILDIMKAIPVENSDEASSLYFTRQKRND
jgi:hypothetical protein